MCVVCATEMAYNRAMKRTSRKKATSAIRASAARREDALFVRVVDIIEAARGHVVRSVNTAMVQAYWLIGREIVEVEQHFGGGQSEIHRAAVWRSTVAPWSWRRLRREARRRGVARQLSWGDHQARETASTLQQVP